MKPNFYLRSLECTNPAVWYSSQVVGLNTLKKTITEMLKSADLDGFFTNHSLRRSSLTYLFQAGVDRKLVKEFTGHCSDAIDQYQITSDKQRENISKVLSGPPKEKIEKLQSSQFEISVKGEGKVGSDMGFCCRRSNVDSKGQVSDMLDKLISSGKGLKTKVKIEVEFGCE